MGLPGEDPCLHWVHLVSTGDTITPAVEGRTGGAVSGAGIWVGLTENLRLERRLEGGEGINKWVPGGVSRWREQPQRGPEGTFPVVWNSPEARGAGVG